MLKKLLPYLIIVAVALGGYWLALPKEEVKNVGGGILVEPLKVSPDKIISNEIIEEERCLSYTVSEDASSTNDCLISTTTKTVLYSFVGQKKEAQIFKGFTEDVFKRSSNKQFFKTNKTNEYITRIYPADVFTGENNEYEVEYATTSVDNFNSQISKRSWLEKILGNEALALSTTTIPTSDQTYYANSSDWATARGASSGTAYGIIAHSCRFTGGQYYIGRYFATLETSFLGSSATISAVDYSFWQSDYAYPGNNRAYGFYSSTHSDTVDPGDYDLAGTTLYSNTLTDNTINANDGNYTTWNFNATGIAAINKTGKTKISGREVNYDIANTPCSTEGYNAGNLASAASNKPYMTITYTIPSASNPVANIINFE